MSLDLLGGISVRSSFFSFYSENVISALIRLIMEMEETVWVSALTRDTRCDAIFTQKGYAQNNDLESQTDDLSLTPRSQGRPPQNGTPNLEEEDGDQEDMEGSMAAETELVWMGSTMRTNDHLLFLALRRVFPRSGRNTKKAG